MVTETVAAKDVAILYLLKNLTMQLYASYYKLYTVFNIIIAVLYTYNFVTVVNLIVALIL